MGGVQPLLDAIVDYLPSPENVKPIIGIDCHSQKEIQCYANDSDPLSALAFKIANDPFVGSLTFTRIYSGMLENGQVVYNSIKKKHERIGRMLQMHANDRT